VLPTGEQFEIRAGDVHAIVTEVGAGLRALSHGDRHLIETFAEDARPARGMGAVLVPWPNRTAHGKWQWNGGEQQLALTEPAAGNAIHGLLRHVVYQVGERADDAITLVAVIPPQPGWPVALATGIRYAVDGAGLTVTHTVRNVGTEPVPFGVGAHPYLRAGDAPIDDCVLTVAAATTIPLDGGLPTGPATAVPAELDLRAGRPVKELDLDNAFGGAAPAEGDTHVRHQPRRAGRHHRAVGRPGVRLRAGVHPAGPGGPGPRGGRRADDLPTRRAQHRRRPDHARPGRDLVGELGNSATGGDMKIFNGVDELRAAAGTHVGASDWMTVDQSRVDTFADATEDHQWIHVDPEKAKDGPFGGPIAHGFLTLSLLSHLLAQVYRIDGTKMGINYGLNKVRFTAPVPVGSKIRGVVDITDVEDAKGGAVQVTTRITVEIEGSERPALVAEWITRQYA
jgi:aldose 1-epimerase